MRFLLFFLYTWVIVAAALTVSQRPLVDPRLHPISNEKSSSRKLHGRFLHITDVHLDRFYRPGTSTDEENACHRGEGRAGYLGAEGTECDSPLSLVNETFEWIEKNLKDEIDFIVWSGDSARHDNDEHIPRTEKQVEELNEYLVAKFTTVFTKEKSDPTGKLSIPIVPNIGNNDVMPHNIFTKGPNTWTKKLARIWKKFIPEEQRHTFLEGGWFSSEVIPSKLAVFSLNSLYFFDSNNAVDGCASKSEPGYQHMEWLRVQLQLLRERGMKAILLGHVPPARAGGKQNWDESCWQKYTLWLLQYRDVVVGSLYGHMNVDHFILQDTRDISIAELLDREATSTLVPFSSIDDDYDDDDEKFTTESKASYLASLRENWSRLPSPPHSVSRDSDNWVAPENEEDTIDSWAKGRKKKKFLKKIGGHWAERYAVALVAPSIVPNFYPALRVVEYNVTGLEHALTWAEAQENDSFSTLVEIENRGDDLRRQSKFTIPEPPSPSAPPGPAYSNQPLTFLGYTQYYANLTRLEEKATSKKHVPIEFEVEYETQDHIYKMDDMTVLSYFKLATRMARKYSTKEDTVGRSSDFEIRRDGADVSKKHKKKNVKNKIWHAFLDRAFVGYFNDDELDDMM